MTGFSNKPTDNIVRLENRELELVSVIEIENSEADKRESRLPTRSHFPGDSAE